MTGLHTNPLASLLKTVYRLQHDLKVETTAFVCCIDTSVKAYFPGCQKRQKYRFCVPLDLQGCCGRATRDPSSADSCTPPCPIGGHRQDHRRVDPVKKSQGLNFHKESFYYLSFPPKYLKPFLTLYDFISLDLTVLQPMIRKSYNINIIHQLSQSQQRRASSHY